MHNKMKSLAVTVMVLSICQQVTAQEYKQYLGLSENASDLEVLGRFAVFTEKTVTMNDRSQIYQTGVDNIIGGENIEIGVDAFTKTVISENDLSLRNRSHVNGDAIIAGVIDSSNAGVPPANLIDGDIYYEDNLRLPELDFFSPDSDYVLFPLPELTDARGNPIQDYVNSGEQRVFSAQEHHPAVTVNGGTMVLEGCGVYYFDKLTVNSGSTVVVPSSKCGITKIFIADRLYWRGQLQAPDNDTLYSTALLWGIFGPQVILEDTFWGTVVAPNGHVVLGSGKYLFGAIYSLLATVHQDATIVPSSNLGIIKPLTPTVAPAFGINDLGTPIYRVVTDIGDWPDTNGTSRYPAQHLNQAPYRFFFLNVDTDPNSQYAFFGQLTTGFLTTTDFTDSQTQTGISEWTLGMQCNVDNVADIDDFEPPPGKSRVPGAPGNGLDNDGFLQSPASCGFECAAVSLVGPYAQDVVLWGVRMDDEKGNPARPVFVEPTTADDGFPGWPFYNYTVTSDFYIKGKFSSKRYYTDNSQHFIYSFGYWNNNGWHFGPTDVPTDDLWLQVVHNEPLAWETSDVPPYDRVPVFPKASNGVRPDGMVLWPGDLDINQTLSQNSGVYASPVAKPFFGADIDNFCWPDDFDACYGFVVNHNGGGPDDKDLFGQLLTADLQNITTVSYGPGDPLMAVDYGQNEDECGGGTDIILFYEDEHGNYQLDCPTQKQEYMCAPIASCPESKGSVQFREPDYFCGVGQVCCNFFPANRPSCPSSTHRCISPIASCAPDNRDFEYACGDSSTVCCAN